MNEDYMKQICNQNRKSLGMEELSEAAKNPCRKPPMPYQISAQSEVVLSKPINLDEIILSLQSHIVDLEREAERLRTAMSNAREVYIGMDGFIPQTAPEGYCLRIIEQMYNELCDKPGGN